MRTLVRASTLKRRGARHAKAKSRERSPVQARGKVHIDLAAFEEPASVAIERGAKTKGGLLSRKPPLARFTLA